MNVIWGKREGKYFFKQDWTGRIALIPQENFFFRRIRVSHLRRCGQAITANSA